jgi:hypothetical protein
MAINDLQNWALKLYIVRLSDIRTSWARLAMLVGAWSTGGLYGRRNGNGTICHLSFLENCMHCVALKAVKTMQNFAIISKRPERVVY